MCDNVVSTVRFSLLTLVKFSFLFFSYLLLVFITPVNKDYQKPSGGYWRGYLPGARCKLFPYRPADVNATPSSLAPVKSRMVRLTQVVLEKRPLNGCSSLSFTFRVLTLLVGR